MNSLDRTIQRARARVTAALALRGAGWGLTLGAAAGVLLLIVDRLTALRLPAWGYVTVAAGGALLGAVRAWARRPDRTAIAVTLDRRLALKDRLGTAATLDGLRRRTVTPFADLAQRDAERVTEGLDVRGVTPVRPTRIWMAAAAVAAGLTAGFIALPEALGGATRADVERRQAATRLQRDRIVETIDEAVANVEKDTVDEQSRGELEMLEQLAAQLDGASAPQVNEARDQSAAALTDVAERMAREADRNIEAIDEVTRRFGRIPPPEDLPETPAKLGDFADALRRGDLSEAADRFDELIEQSRSEETPAQETVAEQLRELARQIEQQAEDGPETASDESLQRALDDLGLDEQDLARHLENPHAEDAPVDPETLRRLAEDLERQQERRDLDRAADERTRDLARALEDAAEDLRQPDPPTPPPPPDDARPGQQQQPRDAGDQGAEDRPASQGEQREGRQPAPQDQGAERQPTASQRPDGAAPSERPDGEARDQQRPREQGPAQGQERSQEQGRDQASGEQPGTEPTPGQQERAMREVSRLLREMERSRQGAREQREVSEQLQRAARDLADTLTDEQKEQLARQWLAGQERGPAQGLGAGDRPGEPGSPDRSSTFAGRTEDLDLRGEPPPDRAIAEWLADEPIDGVPRTERRQATVTRARRAAEQAVEKSTVPSRYHDLIRRYFGRLPETTGNDGTDRDGS